jgi:hypothetical protein
MIIKKCSHCLGGTYCLHLEGRNLEERIAFILRVEMITDERLVLLEVVSSGQTMWTVGQILLRLEKQGA